MVLYITCSIVKDALVIYHSIWHRTIYCTAHIYLWLVGSEYKLASASDLKYGEQDSRREKAKRQGQGV